MSNKTSNRTIYVPPEEYAEWERVARVEAAARDGRLSVSNLIREAVAAHILGLRAKR